MKKREAVSLSAPNGRPVGRLVRVGGMLFSSSITGVDPDTGALDGKPAAQCEAAFRNLDRLLADAGARSDGLGLVTVCLADGAFRDSIQEPWRAMFPDPEDQPACRTNEYPLPEGELVQLQVAGADGQTRRRVVLTSASLPGPVASAARVGNVIFSDPIDGRDPSSGRLSDDRKTQMRQAFRNMEALVEQAGGTKDEIVHVYIFVPGRPDQQDMLDVWLEAFPRDGDRPARKAIFYDALQGGARVIELMVVAVLGEGERHNLEVPGTTKRHPNPMGASIGNLVFSSGISGQNPDGNQEDGVAARARSALENMRTVVEQAGGCLADVGQVAITVNDYADEEAILVEWRRVFPDPSDEPARHVMAFGGRGTYPVQLHMVAAMEPHASSR